MTPDDARRENIRAANARRAEIAALRAHVRGMDWLRARRLLCHLLVNRGASAGAEAVTVLRLLTMFPQMRETRARRFLRTARIEDPKAPVRSLSDAERWHLAHAIRVELKASERRRAWPSQARSAA